MKKIITVLVLTCAIFNGYSQENQKEKIDLNDSIIAKNTSKKVGRHELKFDIIKPIAYQAIEITYEFIKLNKLGFGASILFNADKTNRFNEDFSIAPFARFYFQNPNKQSGNGLFLEGFGKYIIGRYRVLDDKDVDYNSTAVGLGVGYKWLFKSGLIVEPILGFSQSISRSNIEAPTGNLRSDISVGYRF